MSEQPEPTKTIAQLTTEYRAITKARDEANRVLTEHDQGRQDMYDNWLRWDRQHSRAGRELLEAIEEGRE